MAGAPLRLIIALDVGIRRASAAWRRSDARGIFPA
jgi:hypothetical protein